MRGEGKRLVGRVRRALVFASLLLLPVATAVGVIGCTPTDPITDDIYIQDLFVWDGAAWNQITTNGGGGLALDDLTDVTAPAPNVNDALTWNGAAWVNQAGGPEADPIFTASPSFGITALQIAAWDAHPALTTGIHGVGAGDIVGTTLVQELDSKTLDSSVGKGTWTASGTWKLPAMYFNDDITTDRWLSHESNTFLGRSVAGLGNLAHTGGSEGYYNTAFGYQTLQSITTGTANTAFGNASLPFLTDGNFNTAIGSGTMVDLVSGDYNTAIGMFAGHENLGDRNVFIGFSAGYNYLGDNALFIDNSDTVTPLVYGDFSTDALTINGTLSMATHQISDVVDPTLAQDAATKNYVDTEIAGIPGGGGGGLYGINVETLAGDKTLTANVDKIYQYLDEGGANRIITLATAGATAGDRFIIRHNGAYDDTHYLEVKQAAISLESIYAGIFKQFIFDGTNWISGENGTGENDNKRLDTAIGYLAQSYDNGTAFGRNAKGYNYGAAFGLTASGYGTGVAIGNNSTGYTQGVGIGANANGSNYGVAVGRGANTNETKYSIALGYYSETERTSETSINIDGNVAQKNNAVQGRWAKATANATPVEMFCGGVANQRFLVRASSALAFTMKIVARDNVAGHVAMWTVADGLIKRDAANNTTMVTCTVVEVADESTDWAVAVTADDTNEALIITVTGDPTNPTQFAAVMDGVETHF